MDKLISILGAVVCAVCAVMLCVKIFGGYPPSYGNYGWFAGAFLGAIVAAPLFDRKSGN